MRRFLLVALFALYSVSCGSGEKTVKNSQDEPKKQEEQSEPVDLGDNTAPVQVKALKGAKEVKKRIDAQRQEDRGVVEEANK